VTQLHELRPQVEAAIASGAFASARDHLRALWLAQPTGSTAGFILRCRERMPMPLTDVRLAIIRSFTVEPVVPFLEASAFLEGIRLTTQLGDFNTYAQELLNPESALYRFAPQVVIAAIQTRDLLPQLWDAGAELEPKDSEALVARTLEQVDTWLRAFRQTSMAHLILHNFERPLFANAGILDQQSLDGQAARIAELNLGVLKLARQHQNVYVMDYDGLIARHGRDHWFDAMKWSTVRLPISTTCIQHLGKEWLRYLHALTGRVRKVLVTDLDNTLWGGLAGEEGVSEVQLDDTYRGAAYRNVQRALLDLHSRGILLAINSKNNAADALKILSQHPNMLLRPEHFAAQRINWQDKAQNIREMAAELNLGIDSFVFLDDNPVERQRIRTELPEVEVIELPADPQLYERTIRESVLFERVSLTEEDRARNQQYRDQRQRMEVAQSASSVEEFFHSLKQKVVIRNVAADSLARVSQLTKKTNQFNLTTKRYSEEEIAALMAQPGWSVYSVQVQDRFGDNGIVGVVITKTAGAACEIDTFLLSCRVIGRTVEQAILSHLTSECAERGLTELRGRYIPTAKNQPAAMVFHDHGFTQQADEGSAGAVWALNLSAAPVTCPAWISLEAQTFASHASY
jgi:FkbH-like protein